jgi:hypothetical protein
MQNIVPFFNNFLTIIAFFGLDNFGYFGRNVQ